MADPAPANNSKPWSYYAFGLGAIAVGVLALAVLVAFLANGKVTDSKDVIALVGGVASPIVSMVSAYFGITPAAKSQTESAANQNNKSDQAIACTGTRMQRGGTECRLRTLQSHLPLGGLEALKTAARSGSAP